MKTEKSDNSIQKPTSQYLISVSIGVLVILAVTAIAYYGVFQNHIL
jgi:hypothetical protein